MSILEIGVSYDTRGILRHIGVSYDTTWNLLSQTTPIVESSTEYLYYAE